MNTSTHFTVKLASLFLALIPVLTLWGVSGVFILLPAAILLVISNYDVKLQLEKIDWIYIGILCFPLFSVVLSMQFNQSWEWQYVDIYMRYPLGALAFFFLLKGHNAKLDLKWIKIGFYATALIGFSWALCQKQVLGIYLAGAGVFSISFGEIMTVVAVISALRFDDSKVNAPIWRVLAFVLSMLASLMSGAKGSWVAYPVLLWLLFDFYYNKNLGKQLLLFFSTMMVLSAVLWSVPFSKQRIQGAVSDVTAYFNHEEFTPSSQGLRLLMWDTALSITKDNLLVGVGAPQVSAELKARCEHSEVESVAKKYQSYQVYLVNMHSEWMEILAGQGIVGFLGFLFLMFYTPFICFQSRNRVSGEARVWAYLHLLVQMGFIIFSLTVCPQTAARNFWITLGVLSFAGFRRKSLS